MFGVSMMIIFQIVGVVLAVILSILISRQKPSALRTILQWNSVAVAGGLLAYLFEMLSTVREEALLAVFFENLALGAIVCLTVEFVSVYCEAKFPKWIKWALYVDIALCEAVICTSQFGHNLQYKSYDIARSEGGFSVFKSDPGPAYYWYAASIIIGILLCLGTTFSAFKRTSSSTKKRSYLFVLLACAPALAFFPVKFIDLFNGYDIGSILMMLMTICFFILTARFRIFDLASVAKENVLQSISESVVVLDSEGAVIYSNKVALDTFAELNGEHKDKFVSQLMQSQTKEFNYGDHDYEWKSNGIYNGKRFEGLALCITDVSYLKSDNRALASKIDEQTEKIREQSRKLADAQQQIIFSMAELIDSRGQGGEHFKRTAAIVTLLARTLQVRGYFSNTLTDSFIDRLSKATPLYDIGKIVVPDSILNKPGRFTKEEFEVMKTHATEGGRIVRSTLHRLEDKKFTDMAYDIATYHHEKYNGSGYPSGISGDTIPLSARIIAIADVFDELISERSYKTAVPISKAFKMIEAGKGTHFDPIITDVFVSLRSRIEELIND
ncbi:MAG: HD domain-containing protein [Ruminococcaceae bacterium]|nr:HD domain-containing protein [Oscillospiraceae bacterium]